MALEDIKSKIIGDAKIEADKILKEAEKQAASIIKDAEDKVNRLVSDMEEKVDRIKQQEIERRKIVARLEVKKQILAAKRKLIESVFALVRSKLERLPEDKYLSFIERLLRRAVESPNGEIVVGKDEGYIDSSFIDEVNKKYGWKLKFSGKSESFHRGLILRYGDIDINLSFDAIFRDIKENWERKVTKDLFGGE